MVWSAQLEAAVRADDVDTFRALLSQGHDPCGFDEGGGTLWAVANELSSACYRVLCLSRPPEETARHKHARYLPTSSNFLCRANVHHRAGLALLLHPVLLRLVNLWRMGRGGWGESKLYTGGSHTCATLLAFFLPMDDLRKLDASLANVQSREIAIAIGDGALDLVVVSQDLLASQTLHASLASMAHDAGDDVADLNAVRLVGLALERADASLQTATRPLDEPMRCVCVVPVGTKRLRYAWRSMIVWTTMHDAARLKQRKPPKVAGDCFEVHLAAGVRVATLAGRVPERWRTVMSGGNDDAFCDGLVLLAPGQVVECADENGAIRVTPGGHGAGFFIDTDAHERLPTRTSLGR